MEFIPDRKEPESQAAETTDITGASVAKDGSDALPSGPENTVEPSSEEQRRASIEQVTGAAEDTPSEGTGRVASSEARESRSEGPERLPEVTSSENGNETSS